MKELKELYLAFLRIGSVAFGGGYALLPILQRDLEEKRHWITTDELMDYFAIGQCTPGVIALNVSTFIGYKRKGVAGAIISTLGFLTVPIVLILILAAFLENFAEYPVVQHAFAGIRVCVCVLILQAVMRLWPKAVIDFKSAAIYVVVLCLTLFSKYLPITIPTAALVIAAGIFGILLSKEARQSETGAETSTNGNGGKSE